MHEVSLMTSILDIARQEMEAHGAAHLKSLQVRCGVLANVVPESMQFAFDAMKADCGFEDAELILTEEALKLKCPACGREFIAEDRNDAYLPCEACGHPFGFTVLEGDGIFLDRLEAD